MVEPTKGTLHIGILSCDNWQPKFSGKWGDVDDQFKKFLQLPGTYQIETTTFNCKSKQLPTLQQLDSFDGFIITGSRHAVYDKEQDTWLEPLRKLILECDQKHKKLFGVCFGHQLIGQTLGGEVEQIGFNIARQNWNTSQDFSHPVHFDFNSFPMIGIHEDQVTKVPPNCQVWASNEKCKIAGLLKDHHILTIQPHPEFTNELLKELLITKAEGGLEQELVENAIKTLDGPLANKSMADWVVNAFFAKSQ